MRDKKTWFAVLKLLLFVVIHHDVGLHGDQLLLVELPEVEQGELVELLVAEQYLSAQERREMYEVSSALTPSEKWAIMSNNNI